MSDRKQQILDIALELLQTRVFSAFSYQDIADRLGITKAAIHSHYRSKEILGSALLEQYLEHTIELHNHADSISESALERLKFYVSELERMTIGSSKVCIVAVLQVEHNVIPESLKIGVSKIYQCDKIWVNKTLTLGREQGTMHFHGSTEDQVNLVQAAIHGALLNSRAEGGEVFTKTIQQLLLSMKAE